jgi:hypothetical protein
MDTLCWAGVSLNGNSHGYTLRVRGLRRNRPKPYTLNPKPGVMSPSAATDLWRVKSSRHSRTVEREELADKERQRQAETATDTH